MSLSGTGVTAQFYFSSGIAFAKGNLYVTDRNNFTLRKITLAGVSSTVDRLKPALLNTGIRITK